MLSDRLLEILNFNKKTMNNAFINSFMAIGIFLLFNAMGNNDIIREEFGDYGYDMAIKGYATISNDSSKLPKIITLLVDEPYLKEHNLSDNEGGIRFNYTPRRVIANILDDLDRYIKKDTPKAVFIDYAFKYSGSIDGSITNDDKKLINALNKYAKKYPIYMPTSISKLFIEDQNLSKNIHFVSSKMFHYGDGIERGYEPYICKNGKYIENIITIFSNPQKFPDGNCTKQDESYKKYFNYRILYKDINEHHISNYKNIKIYSATEIDDKGAKIVEDFSNSIVLIGSNYKNSGDIHNTPIGKMSGIYTITNGITSTFITKNKLHSLSATKSALIYFFIFMIASLFIPKLLIKLGLKSEPIQYLTTLLLNVLIFYILSVALLMYLHIWLNWIIPWLVFQLMDGKILIRNIYIKIKKYIKKSVKEV